jgi:hypothetical protein
MRRLRYLVGVALLGCGSPAPKTAPELAQYLNDLSGSDARWSAVLTWKLTRDEWNATVVEPYRGVYDEYARWFEEARDMLVSQLVKKHSMLARAHFAGDTTATDGQAMTRWALPTLAPSRVAELAGRPPAPIDAVFVDIGGRWKAIVGIDQIVKHRVAILDEACAEAISRIDPAGGRCIETAWAVADAALRADRARFAHACGLAANLCGKPAP